jgi:hypothetical protein
MFKVYIVIAAIVVAVVCVSRLPFFQNFTANELGVEKGGSDTLALTTADVGTSRQTDKGTPPLTETAVPKPVDESQAESVESSSDALFRQFQAWAAAHKDNDRVKPAQAVQDVPAKEDAPKRVASSIRKPPTFVQKNRDARPVAHRQESTARSPRKQPQPMQSAQVQVPASLQAESQWSRR